ncbi:manganese efflux pump MntP [Sphingosinicella rhizophila]|uniref:Putative manganese efflux pump MntP n=1 Tax=Sphingosinicella rhizophila TaxID=3050082 RepID=A0ABU3QBF8_9SPHN|nr:manganese efflux pump MntP family protein [Sphingosinicella sp. GR2756]MDT9600713.1 manganese efflux pump MntP family protein [Sphingosinicella sp. GR2756]
MITLLLLAVALAMDAFAVALVQGASCRLGFGGAVRIALVFGLAQGLMPLVGWSLGFAFADTFQQFDHWIAFLLLGLLGGRMIRDGIWYEPDAPEAKRLFMLSLLVSSLATSVDAAAAGLTLPLLGQPIPTACLVIGATTALLSFGGALIGRRVGVHFGKKAELVGGILLVGLGIRILVEHLGLA